MDSTPNLLTVDLEEWFVVEVFARRFGHADWPELPATIVRNSRRLLELFRQKGVSATWFCLGWAAERYPDLLREIADNGHEIGCHSFGHRRVDQMDEQAFREDTERATEAISRALDGVRPLGYRAPSWSINDRVPWAFRVLAELGYKYDSSIFPIKHDIYGMPQGPRSQFEMKFDNGLRLIEVPSSTFRIGWWNFPISGGGYLRHSPYWYYRFMINRLNSRGLPAVIYVHPWEIDPDLPALKDLTMLQRFRTYGSTSVFYHKLSRLLSDFRFVNMADFIGLHRKRRIGFERA